MNKIFSFIFLFFLTFIMGCSKIKPVDLVNSELHSGYNSNVQDWVNFLDCWKKSSESSEFSESNWETVGDKLDNISSVEGKIGFSFSKSFHDYIEATKIFGFMNDGLFFPLSDVDLIFNKEKKLEKTIYQNHKDSDKFDNGQYFIYGKNQDYMWPPFFKNFAIIGYLQTEDAFINANFSVRFADNEIEYFMYYFEGEFRATNFGELARQLYYYDVFDVDHVPPYSQKKLKGTCADLLPMNAFWK